MKKTIIFLLIYLFFINLNAIEIKFEKIQGGLDNPWSLSFINQESILFTEKRGKLYLLNLKNKKLTKLKKTQNVIKLKMLQNTKT